MGRVLTVVLAFGVALAAQARSPDIDLSQFPAAQLEALTTEKPADAKVVALESLKPQIERGTFSLRAAPADVEYEGVRFRRETGQFRTVATYTGKHRETGPALRRAIEHWGGLVASREGYGTAMFRTELEFLQDGKAFWLPVNVLALGGGWPDSRPVFHKGEPHVLLGHSVGWLESGAPVLIVIVGAPERALAAK